MQDLIKEFLAQKKFAAVRATNDPDEYGNQIVKKLKKRGYEVYLTNPKLKQSEDLKCYASLDEIPVKVDVVDFLVPPEVTEAVLKVCKRPGPYRIRLQPGSENEAAIKNCHANGLKVVHDVCVMLS